MQLSDLQTLIGNLTNDPNHERYVLSDINTELDNSQDKWNVSAKIIKDTVTITVVSGTRQYALSGLTGTPISFPRATHKGLELKKRSKSWLDLYSGGDWTAVTGTPTIFIIEDEDPNNQFLTVYPTPTANDAGAYLISEYIKRHTSMVASTDVPFMSVAASNNLLRPYDWGLAYDVAARLLARDPNEVNVPKAGNFDKIARNVMADVIQVFKAVELDEPGRLRTQRRRASWL